MRNERAQGSQTPKSRGHWRVKLRRPCCLFPQMMQVPAGASQLSRGASSPAGMHDYLTANTGGSCTSQRKGLPEPRACDGLSAGETPQALHREQERG